MKSLLAAGLIVLSTLSLAGAAEPGSKDFRPTPEHPVGYRGDGSGHYPGAHPVTSWDVATGKNIIWKTELPTWSHAHPIIVGDKVYALGEPHFVYCLDANTGKILWQDALDHIDLMDEETKAEARKVEAMQNDWASMQNVPLIGGRLYYTFYVGQNGYRGRREADPETPWQAGGPGRYGTEQQRAINQQWIEKHALAGSIKTCHQEWSERYDLAIRNWVSWVGFTYAPMISDGEHVYVALGNNQAACYTLDGKRVWAKWHRINSATAKHPLPFDIWGSSQLVPAPILCDGLLVDCRKNVVRAMDAKTGALEWWRLRAVEGGPASEKDDEEGPQQAGNLTFADTSFTRPAVARVPFGGTTVAVLITGDGYLYRLSDGLPLFDSRAKPLPGKGWKDKSEQVVREHTEKIAAMVGRTFTCRLPETNKETASSPVAEGDRVFLRGRDIDHICGVTLKLVAADTLEWTLDWALPGEGASGGRDLMVSSDRIYAGSRVIEKATGKELANHRGSKGSGFGVRYGNLLLVGEDRVFSGGDGQNQGIYDARTFRPLGNGSFNVNPGDKKGTDLPPERMQELKRAGIIFGEGSRLNWGSFATFSGNRMFVRTQWGVYCIGDPTIGWK